jgi:hypothetical protein
MRTIDERAAYLDYVFGYDDTERTTVHFDWPPDNNSWTVTIIEGDGQTQLAKAVVENIPEDWEPDIGLAEDILLRYWRGEFPKNTHTKPTP